MHVNASPAHVWRVLSTDHSSKDVVGVNGLAGLGDVAEKRFDERLRTTTVASICQVLLHLAYYCYSAPASYALHPI